MDLMAILKRVESAISNINAGGALQTVNAYYTPSAAGWYRVAKFHMYSSFIVYAEAQWSTGEPTNAIWSVTTASQSKAEAVVRFLGGVLTGVHASRLRLTVASGNYLYLEFYSDRATAARINVMIVGRSEDGFSEITHPTNPVSGSPTVVTDVSSRINYLYDVFSITVPYDQYATKVVNTNVPDGTSWLLLYWSESNISSNATMLEFIYTTDNLERVLVPGAVRTPMSSGGGLSNWAILRAVNNTNSITFGTYGTVQGGFTQTFNYAMIEIKP